MSCYIGVGDSVSPIDRWTQCQLDHTTSEAFTPNIEMPCCAFTAASVSAHTEEVCPCRSAQRSTAFQGRPNHISAGHT